MKDAFNGTEILVEKPLPTTLIEKICGVKAVKFHPSGLVVCVDSILMENAAEIVPHLYKTVSEKKKLRCVFENTKEVFEIFQDDKGLTFRTETPAKVACFLKLRGISNKTILDVLSARTALYQK